MTYEILKEGVWSKTTKNRFYSWSGRRRRDGHDYIGPIVWLASKRKPSKRKLPSLKIALQRSLDSVS